MLTVFRCIAVLLSNPGLNGARLCDRKMLPNGCCNTTFVDNNLLAMHRAGVKEAVGNIRSTQKGILSLHYVLI